MAVLAGLGELRFEISDLVFQGLERNFQYRWEAQNRLGRRPAQQFMGPGEETISLEGVIYPNHPMFSKPMASLNKIRSQSMTGQPFRFGANVGGQGRNLGRWVVKSIRDKQSYFNQQSSPGKVEFTIEMVEYGADGASFQGFF